MSGINELDHLIFTTADLDRCRERFERLGFQLTPRGVHEQLGTANHTAMFADGTYLELLAILSPRPANAPYQAALELLGEGIGGIAIKVDDAEQFHGQVGSSGIEPEHPLRFGRWVEEAGDFARFTIVRLPGSFLPPLTVFACQHHTPDYVWRPDRLVHPNGVTGIARVEIEDSSGWAAAALVPLFGAADRGPDSAQFDRLLVRSGAGSCVRIVAVTLTVDDLGRTREWLDESRIAYTLSAGALQLIIEGANVALNFSDQS